MGDVVCLSSGDEMELEDIVEVYEEPLEDPQIGLSLIPEPSILRGLVSPEDLGINELNHSIHTNTPSMMLPLPDSMLLQNTENSDDDPITNKTHHINKKSKIKTTIFNHEPKINAETEMRISISKKHKGCPGESTQVKILIPSTSSTSSNLKCGNVSGPSSSSTSIEKINEYKTHNTVYKRTARKSMSSFTPRTEIPMLSKPRNNDVVTLDSDDEKDSHVSDLLQQSKKKILNAVHTQNSSNLCDTISGSQDNDRNDTKNNSGKTGCVTSESIGTKCFDNDDHVHKQSQPLEFYMGLFESEWKNHLTSSESEKVKKKMDKRVAAISDHYKCSKVLRGFLLMKKNSVAKEPKKVFPVIKEVLDELTKYGQKHSLPVSELNSGAVTKKRLKLTTCLDAENKLDASLEGMTAKHQPKYYIQLNLDSISKKKLTEEQLLKRERHINKLERALKACGKEIKRCEEEELSLSDMEDENSGYLRVSRYKARYMKVYRKVAQLRKLDASLQRKQDKKYKTEASRIPEINSKIQTLVNKNKVFPDYADILKLYQNHYQENNLIIEKELMKQEAQDTFVAMGKRLKARRKFDEMDVMQSYIPIDKHDDDPADKDDDLKNALEASMKLGEEKMSKVMNEFVHRQVANNEQPEEVPDNEGDNETNAEDDESEEQTNSETGNDNRDYENNSTSNTDDPALGSNKIIKKCTVKMSHIPGNVETDIDNVVEIQSDKNMGK